MMEINDAKKVLERIPPPFGLMRISEAAALAGLNPETLRRRVRRGELAAWGNPRKVLYSDVMRRYEPRLAETGKE